MELVGCLICEECLKGTITAENGLIGELVCDTDLKLIGELILPDYTE